MKQESSLSLSQQSEEVLRLAEEEARRSHHPYIATEHLLFALLSQRDTIALRVLRKLGLSITKLRRTVEFVLPRADHIVQETVAMTTQARQVLACAEYEAQRLHCSSVKPEHLLLGILRQSRGRRGQGLAGAILHKSHVTLDAARTQVATIYTTLSEQSTLSFAPPEAAPSFPPLSAASPLVPPPPPSLPTPEPVSTLTCAHCGTRCPSNTRFCFICGYSDFIKS